MKEDKTRTSQTLARGLQVIACFQDKGIEYGIKDLSDALHLPTTVVSRLVTTLAEYGYLYQNSLTKKYGLGMTAYTLGFRANSNSALQAAARPVMLQLAQQSGETISLNVVNPATMEGVCIESIESSASVKLTTVVGSVRPLNKGATRKVLLAYLNDGEWGKYLGSVATKQVNLDVLKNELEEIRSRGYAYSEGELDEGAYAIAAPVLNSSGALLAGIAVAGPLFRLTSELRKHYVELVLRAAREIQSLMQRV